MMSQHMVQLKVNVIYGDWVKAEPGEGEEQRVCRQPLEKVSRSSLLNKVSVAT